MHPRMMTFQTQLKQRREAETDYTEAETGNRNRLHRSRDRKQKPLHRSSDRKQKQITQK